MSSEAPGMFFATRFCFWIPLSDEFQSVAVAPKKLGKGLTWRAPKQRERQSFRRAQR